MYIPVTYLCWGCGSSITTEEECDLPIPSREVWNICPSCIKNKEVNNMGYKGMNPPIGSYSVDNPLKNGGRYKKAKANRDKTLAKTGLRPPKTPL
jgi:hypothetical protein